MPITFAKPRVVQWVPSLGFSCVVILMTFDRSFAWSAEFLPP